MMPTAGLWMLLVLGALVPLTGLPVWALLLGLSTAFAAFGVLSGAFGIAVVAVLPARLTGLLEHDLLQAMPLYVFIGMLLQRVAIADALFATLARFFARIAGRGAAPEALASLGLGALTAPMNGSVAASSSLVSRLAGPRLVLLPAGAATALVAAAATVGVVVPPSLVLILLGDAMQRAHTEASNLPGYAQVGQRIVSTQDVLHAALLPAVLLLLLWAVIVGWRAARVPASAGSGSAAPQRGLTRSQAVLGLLAMAGIVLLLAGVFTGRLLAVEGAATAGCLLAGGVVYTRSLSWTAWRSTLADTLAMSGALFALLVGATTFSLVFRLFGTDAWIAAVLMREGLGPWGVAALALGLVMLCAMVLDAFEMIFVIVPIIAPVLVLRLGDAQQTAVLLLMVLQLSFLLPPLGYAVLMAREYRRRDGAPQASLPVLLRALAPLLGAQVAVLALVLMVPAVVHQLDEPVAAQAAGDVASPEEVTRRMEEMLRGGEAVDAAEGAASAASGPTPGS